MHPPRWQLLLHYEEPLWAAGLRHVCGVDEVGLGPLAGPVVAAAVVLPADVADRLPHLDDSKKVTAKRREVLARQIESLALGWGLGAASEAEVDALNVRVAAQLAACRAVQRLTARLGAAPCHLLLDAHPLPQLHLPQTAIIGGDGKSQSIAAASILAKVARDAHMRTLHDRYPRFGFAKHAGYPTRAHLEALQAHGPTPVHRRSFGPVQRSAKPCEGAGAPQNPQQHADARRRRGKGPLAVDPLAERSTAEQEGCDLAAQCKSARGRVPALAGGRAAHGGDPGSVRLSKQKRRKVESG